MHQHPRARKFLVSLGPLAFVFGLCVAIGAQGPVTGAVFTTNSTGTFVNGNVYDSSNDPYINGGPRPNSGSCTAAGLADGDYYFQVTDPSGGELLSTDDVENRRFTVSGGIITSYSGTHAKGTGRCGDVTIQLAPFEATSNPGGEYKVWVTPVDKYLAGSGSFGFISRYSKTDNFKVESVTTDTDGDGIPDVDDNCPLFYDPTNVCYTVR